MKRLTSGFVAIAAVLTIGVSSASATSITVTGDTSFDVSWGSTVATFTITNWDSDSFDLAIAPIDNTLGTAALEAFGFGLDPSATGLSIISDGPVFFVNPTLFPNPNIPGFTVDICAYAGNNCSGGGSAGLATGAVDAFGVSMTIEHDASVSVTFAPIPAKFQKGPGGGPTDATGGECLDVNCSVDGEIPLPPGGAVPEPGTWLLVGSGLALARRMRRNRRA